MAKLKFYYDLLSQPARSIYILLKLTNTPFESCKVPLRKGVHMTEEYRKDVSKFGKVPVIHDGDFRLTESVAILRYLYSTRDMDEKLYPKDIKVRARIDEYLEWQHLNTRLICAGYFRMRFIDPLVTGEQPSESKVTKYENSVMECMKSVEDLWLTPGPYICGNKLTAADIWAATEIEQPRVGFDPTENRPKLSAWLKRVRAELNPYYDEAHEFINRFAAMKGSPAKL